MPAQDPLCLEENLDLSKTRRPNKTRLLIDITLIWAQAILAIVVAVAIGHPLAYALAIALVAGAQHGLSQAAHEAVHGSIAPDSRRVNDLCGRWLFSGPVFVPFLLYRVRHLQHHRKCSELDDTKWLYRRRLDGWYFVVEILRSLSGYDFLAQAVGALKGARRKTIQEQGQAGSKGPGVSGSSLGWDLASILLVQAAIAGALCVIGPWWLYLIVWLLPAISVVPLLSKLRSAVEHRPLPDNDKVGLGTEYYGGTSGPLIRTVYATSLERIWFSKLNFCFHAEHHRWPSASYQYLPALNCAYRGGSALGASGAEVGYLAVVRMLVSQGPLRWEWESR